jgi:hypothetical protein
MRFDFSSFACRIATILSDFPIIFDRTWKAFSTELAFQLPEKFFP